MVKHQSRCACTQQAPYTPAALQKTHTRTPIVLFDSKRLSIDGDIECSLSRSKQAREDDEGGKAGRLRQQCECKAVAYCRCPDYRPASEACNALACQRRCRERARYDTD